MLEMMPGSVVDKTNNNLSNLVCAHSTIEQKTDPGRETGMEAALKEENPVSYINNNVTEPDMTKVNNELSSNETIDNVPDLNDSNVVSNETTENKLVSQEGNVVCTKQEGSHVVSQESLTNNENNLTNSLNLNNKSDNVSNETSENTVESTENNPLSETIPVSQNTESDVVSNQTSEFNVISVSREINKESDVLKETSVTDVVSNQTSENNDVPNVESTENNIISNLELTDNNVSPETNSVVQEINKESVIDVDSNQTSENNVIPNVEATENNVSPETISVSQEINKKSDLLEETSVTDVVSNQTSENKVIPNVEATENNVSPEIISVSQEINKESDILKETSVTDVVSNQTSENNVESTENNVIPNIELTENVIPKLELTENNVSQEIIPVSQEINKESDILKESSVTDIVLNQISENVIPNVELTENNVIPNVEATENNVIPEIIPISLKLNKESDILKDTSVTDIVSNQISENVIPNVELTENNVIPNVELMENNVIPNLESIENNVIPNVELIENNVISNIELTENVIPNVELTENNVTPNLELTENNISSEIIAVSKEINKKSDILKETSVTDVVSNQASENVISNVESAENNVIPNVESTENVELIENNVSPQTISVSQEINTESDILKETSVTDIVSNQISENVIHNIIPNLELIENNVSPEIIPVSQEINKESGITNIELTENVIPNVESTENNVIPNVELIKNNISPETISVSQEINKESDILTETPLTDVVSNQTSENNVIPNVDSTKTNVSLETIPVSQEINKESDVLTESFVIDIVSSQTSENDISQKINETESIENFEESDVLGKISVTDNVLDEISENNITSEHENKIESIEKSIDFQESDILSTTSVSDIVLNRELENNSSEEINKNVTESIEKSTDNQEINENKVVLIEKSSDSQENVAIRTSVTDQILDQTLENNLISQDMHETKTESIEKSIENRSDSEENINISDVSDNICDAIWKEINENEPELIEKSIDSQEITKEFDIFDKTSDVISDHEENKDSPVIDIVLNETSENKIISTDIVEKSVENKNISAEISVPDFVSVKLSENNVNKAEISEKSDKESFDELDQTKEINENKIESDVQNSVTDISNQISENCKLIADINVNNEIPIVSQKTNESHSTVDKTIERETCNVETKNIVAEITENREESETYVPEIADEKMEIDSVPEIVNKCEKTETDSTNSLKKTKNKENKLLSFLQKNKLTIKDIIPKLKCFKRQTKDRRKPNCVLSLKLNRFYFKSNKPKWCPQRRGKPKKPKKEKPQPQTLTQEDQPSTSSLDNQTEDSVDSTNLDFKADDDIRNKIKEQLLLLRQTKKPKPTPEFEEIPEYVPVPEESSLPDPESEKLIINPSKSFPSLEDVVLSKGDGGLSIVSVVGGYFSDDDSRHSIEKIEEKKDHPPFLKGVSMADILLKREFNSYLITPTKTNDITKIKGWRTKHFAPTDTEEETENAEKLQKIVPQMENTIENPIPSTSFDFVENKTENILKSGEKTVETNTKSAFISDELDSYLNNHSELKISYEVPKLVAEETISKPQSEIPVGNSNYLKVVNKMPYKKKPICNKVFKPKTLAEKRRMLEKDRQNQLLHDMEINESVYLKQLEYCEKRNKNEVAKDVRENLLAKETPISRHCWNMTTKLDKYARQFVIVNGNKIRILGSYGGNDIVVPNEIKRRPTVIHKREVSYKPGPLSKKHKLISNKENWECKVLTMPKIKLIVCPEPGKSLPLIAEQYIQMYRGEKGYIDTELAKFAVSAVRTTNTVKNKFEFDVPYRNGQNKLVVRKKIFKPVIYSPEKILPKKEYTNIDVEDSIKTIMSNMLNCVQNQELDKLIIKDDPDLRNKIDKNVDRPPSPIDPRVQAIIKRPNARKSRTTLELRRLNVQVIEVDVKEEEQQEMVSCNKDFCKLGCVCKSLRGATSLVPEHCGKVNCMLECSCSFGSTQRGHHSITLPAGTDLLSASTVVRLQDEVKKNLAKEEREFAQTVIKANNQTIMVGGGARERARRIPKVPKKYSNFVSRQKGFSYEKLVSSGLLEEIADDDFESMISKQAIQKAKEESKKDLDQRILEVELKKPVPIWNKQQTRKMLDLNIHDCHIKLPKLSLENIVPWCMVHNLYKCHCDGKSLFETTPVKIDKKEEPEKKEEIDEEEYITYAPRFQPRIIPESAPPSTITDLSEKYCARTRAIGTNYYQARNKSQSFKARYALIKRRELQNEELRQETLKIKLVEPKEKPSSVENQDLLVPRLNKSKKVTLVNIQDILKKQDKPKPPPTPNPCHVVSAASFIDYERSFLGLLTPSSEWLEKFHKMLNLNLNTVIRQIRLLEWATLVRRHKRGTLQLWFNNKKYNNIILTEDRKRPSKFHMNVNTFQNHTIQNYRLPEIITSLYTNKLPGVATKATETYVILVYNGLSWEARGTIVLNDTSEMCKHRLGHKPTPIYILKPVLTGAAEKQILPKTQKSPPVSTISPTNVNPNILIRSTSSISVEVVNKEKFASNLNNKPNESGLEITKIPVQPPNPSLEVVKTKKDNHILAPLPTGFGMSRWFMLILKNDFSVIRISFSNFHIKYTHLITAIETAKKNKKTVRIRSQDKNVDNPNNFGVYALPGFPDRIFFGPYDSESEHGLETFRYVNGKLVNTKIYHKMRGSVEKNTTGIWYFHSSTVQNNLVLEPQKDSASSGSDCSTEVTSAEKAVKPHIEFVDLTENDSDCEEKIPVDPLFNVLSADFTKKVSGDITIEPVYDNTPKTIHEVKKNDIIIQPISNDDTARLSVIQKENGLKRKSQTSQPKLIDSIELDDDEEEPPKKKRHSDIMKQVPALCPINATLQTINAEVLKKKKVIYVITNIPGIGYFEIFITDKRCMSLNINGKTSMFPTISMALTWLHQLLRRYVFFVPIDLKVKFSILESTDVPEMSKFDEKFLNGYHMLCAKGIFDVFRLSTDDLTNLGFDEQQSSKLLAHKCELVVNRNIKVLGNYLVGPEESSKLGKDKILQIAPRQIKLIESKETLLQQQKQELKTYQSELMVKINDLLKGVPETLKNVTKDKIYDISKISRDENQPLPVGKMKIMDGKIVRMESPPYEMLVPIAGLQTPVTVVGVKTPVTSLLKTARHKVVDLTDD